MDFSLLPDVNEKICLSISTLLKFDLNIISKQTILTFLFFKIVL